MVTLLRPLSPLTCIGDHTVFEVNWASVLIPIAIQFGIAIFFMGSVKSQIEALGTRIGKLEGDTERERDASVHLVDRVHELALGTVRVETMLGEIKKRVESLCLEAADCPLAQGTLVPRRRRRGAEEEDAA